MRYGQQNRIGILHINSFNKLDWLVMLSKAPADEFLFKVGPFNYEVGLFKFT